MAATINASSPWKYLTIVHLVATLVNAIMTMATSVSHVAMLMSGPRLSAVTAKGIDMAYSPRWQESFTVGKNVENGLEQTLLAKSQETSS